MTWLAIAVVAAGGAFFFAKKQAQAPAEQVAPPATGLPHTPDYHALLVSPTDARRIVLGTHAGLYESSDGGRTWRPGQLAGNDAMNLVRTGSGVEWAAGHNVLFQSADGGGTWEEVRPDRLPGLDLHGFAVDSSDGKTLYAAVAGEGLYRSTDGGRTFSLVSKDVGGSVFGLAVLPTGRILAADSDRGVLASDDGGQSWDTVLRAPIVGLAVNPAEPSVVLAAGAAVHLSRDGGRTWRKVFVLAQGGGPVTWAPSAPKVAYLIGYDRVLYRTESGGRSWRAVR
ncbi:MAG TPA: YCF48-related protein [Gaiellaceae bacterium]